MSIPADKKIFYAFSVDAMFAKKIVSNSKHDYEIY